VSIPIAELTTHGYRRCASYRSHLPSFFTSWFEPAHGAVKDNEVRSVSGIAVTVAINVLESLLFKLPNEVFIQRNTKFRWDGYFVRLNGCDLNAPHFEACGLAVSRIQNNAGEEKRTKG
jgi:hypothetical protein